MSTVAAPSLWGSLALLPTRTVPQIVREQADRQPDAAAFQMVEERPLTYRQLYDEACALAAGLRDAGVMRGDAVVVFGPNSLEVVLSWLAINLLGAVEVCINTAYRGAPLVHALNSARARHMIAFGEQLSLVHEVEGQLTFLEQALVVGQPPRESASSKLKCMDFHALRQRGSAKEIRDEGVHGHEQTTASDIASIIYTSGTTGPAKGVLMPHAQVCMLAATTARGLKLAGDDVFYCFHPMFHMAGKFMAVLGTLMAGGRVVLDRSFAPDQWLKRIRDAGATAGLAHGPMAEMIHAQPAKPDDHDNPMRRMIIAPFPTRIARDFEQRFNLRGIEVWGMTEVGVPIWCSLDEPLNLGSCGRADDELFDVGIVDPETDAMVAAKEVGELVVRPRLPWLLMQGYMGMAEETLGAWRNLWFHSGDSAYRDEDGNFYFVDRMKDRIRRRAENISSYEIESASLAHPAVSEAAAVGIASDFQGDDDIKLCVVARQGERIVPEELLAFLARQLPHYMLPRYIETLAALPRTPTNKIRKAELRRPGRAEVAWDRKMAGIQIRDFYGK